MFFVYIKVQSMLQHNFSPQVLFRDLTRVKDAEMPTCDMLWAGFPCQPFSQAGQHGGRPRSSL